MNDMHDADPVAILKEIEESCRSCAVELPGKTRTENEWSGICFRIDGNDLVTPLAEVVEILDIPELNLALLFESQLSKLQPFSFAFIIEI